MISFAKGIRKGVHLARMIREHPILTFLVMVPRECVWIRLVPHKCLTSVTRAVRAFLVGSLVLNFHERAANMLNIRAISTGLAHLKSKLQWRHMSVMASQLRGKSIVSPIVHANNKDTSKLRTIDPLWVNSPLIRGFPSQRASDAEPTSWRHHVIHIHTAVQFTA